MQTAQLLHDSVPGANVQMIGVGQLHLGLDLFQILSRYCSLDGSHRSDIHKNRGLDSSVNGLKLSPFRPALFFQNTIHTRFLR